MSDQKEHPDSTPCQECRKFNISVSLSELQKYPVDLLAKVLQRTLEGAGAQCMVGAATEGDIVKMSIRTLCQGHTLGEQQMREIGKALADPLPPKEWMEERLRQAREEKVDAYRWRCYASSSQTALMLGSDKDPNDTTVDWKAECDRLADETMRKS